MITSQYAYSRTDQLKAPHSYMYTEYEGPEFLSWYREDRLIHLASLLDQGLATLDQCSVQERHRLSGIFVSCRSALTPSLAARLDAHCGGGEGAVSEASRESLRAQLNRDVARFEVTKKLHPGDDLGVYADFSVALMLFHERWGSLKFLNTALKVNDLLCSQPASALRPFAALSAAVSVDLEQRAVARLLAGKGMAHGA